MTLRSAAVALLFCLVSEAATAEVARHETMEYDRYGNPESITVVYANDEGFIRMETYGISAQVSSSAEAASASAGSSADVSYARGSSLGVMVFQPPEERMLMIDRGECQIMNADLTDLPGMPPGGMAEYRQEMAAAQAEIQEAMRELAEEDPAVARMMQERLGNLGGGIPGMPGAPQQAREMIVEETGDDRTIGDYDTTGFLVYEEETNRYRTSVWAADIDDVVGGRIVGNAMKGWLELYRDVMDRLGAGAGRQSGVASAVLDKMDDYYPIVTESSDVRTTLTKAELGASADFYPECG